MRSEGVRRLSILLGIFGVVGWIIFLIIATHFFERTEYITPLGWLLMISGIPVFFLVPYGITCGIAWVVAGFKDDKNSN
jgi:hypothetical protein